MKQLFTIACTLVLGSALSFAQTSTTQNPPAGDTRQNRPRQLPTSIIMAQKSSKKTKKSANTDRLPQRQSKPFTQIRHSFSYQAASHGAAFFTPHGKRFPFPASLLKMCATILYRVERFQKTDIRSQGDQ